MRIFEKDGKTNFVDIADTLVGFDAWQSCCESFGHYFSITPAGEEMGEPENLEALIFDPLFFKESDGHDAGGQASFRLFNPNGAADPVYLTIFNHHNGYYSHGFEFTTGGTVLNSGSL